MRPSSLGGALLASTLGWSSFLILGAALLLQLGHALTPSLAGVSRIHHAFRQAGTGARTRRISAVSSFQSNQDDDDPSSSSSSLFHFHDRLSDCVCLVTGASRGIGKGIALELGAQGAIVYITGTSSSNKSNNNKNDEPGTVQETAEEINALPGPGQGIAVLCDHSQDDQVQALFQQIEREQGRLDILINNAFRLPSGGVQMLYKKFWEQGPEVWDTLHTVGLRSHYVASCYAMPLIFQGQEQGPPRKHLPRPFIGMVSSFGGLCYTFNTAYGVGKAGVDRLAKDMAVELRDKDISVVSFWPGLVDTERTQKSVANGEWDQYVKLPLDHAESPRFTGRAVVHVALDPQNLAQKSGTYQVVAELAQDYGFDDPATPGRVPPSIRSLKFLLPTYGFNAQIKQQLPPDYEKYIPDWKLPFWVMAQGQPPASE